jgi:MYXO-CTERM domain-containing protein
MRSEKWISTREGRSRHPSFSLTLTADGQTITLDDQRLLYFLSTYFPGGGSESEVSVGSTLAGVGADLDVFGDILASSFPSDIRGGPVDVAKSSLSFASSPSFKADVQLTSLTLVGSTAVPEPPTVLLAPLALGALVLARRRANA